MADDKITFTFNCGQCGHQLTWDDEMPDSATIKCGNCGAEVATLGEMKAKAMERAKAEVSKMFRDAFKGSPFKFK